MSCTESNILKIDAIEVGSITASGVAIDTATSVVVIATEGSNPTLNHDAWNTVKFTSIEFNSNSSYSTSTGNFTAPITGIYDVNVLLELDGGFSPGTISRSQIRLLKNGGEFVRGSSNNSPGNYVASTHLDLVLSTAIFLMSNDTITPQVFYSCSNNQTLRNEGYGNRLTIVRLRV